MNVPTLSSVPIRSQAEHDVIAPVWHRVTRGIRAAGFWLAIAIPFLYLPLLYGGLAGPRDVIAFCGLLFLNVVALVVGHGHRR